MYPVITTEPTTSNSNMSRNRSHSTSSSSSPALISRGFASIRRAHRRLSTSTPTSPNLSTGDNSDTHTNETTPTVTPAPLNIPSSAQPSPAQPSSADSESATNTNVRPRIRLVPNVGLSNRSFVFEIVDRELEPGVHYRIGRFSDRNIVSERLSFKSKVVSRNHAELWTENGKVKRNDQVLSESMCLHILYIYKKKRSLFEISGHRVVHF